eukprot:CAMPEP_0194400432 /NCGR_PEP_ID=MMETSP0174-20130528/127227_1 /TAXON_ID=216777 /ORGANISM="Proboscia alata, Strain PI-D3" /LENGTH=210 /DNA_ID=CAMNT_0039196981 /DNA_START=722 /DNA_END=1350 /DNA_ORIENTATION=-
MVDGICIGENGFTTICICAQWKEENIAKDNQLQPNLLRKQGAVLCLLKLPLEAFISNKDSVSVVDFKPSTAFDDSTLLLQKHITTYDYKKPRIVQLSPMSFDTMASNQFWWENQLIYDATRVGKSAILFDNATHSIWIFGASVLARSKMLQLVIKHMPDSAKTLKCADKGDIRSFIESIRKETNLMKKHIAMSPELVKINIIRDLTMAQA